MSAPRESPSPTIPPHVQQALQSTAGMHSRALASVDRHQRSIEWLTGRLGQPSSLYVIVASVAGLINCPVTGQFKFLTVPSVY